MLLKEISHILSKYLFYLSIALLIPLSLAAYYQFLAPPCLHPQPHSTQAFFFTFLLSVIIASLFRLGGRGNIGQLYRRESIVLVVLLWLITSLISALPFYFSHTLTRPIDAFFESMSGLTTTGASVICPKLYDSHTQEELPIHITNQHVPDTTYSYYGTVAPIRDPNTGLVLHCGIEAVGKALLLWRSLLQWIGGIGIVVIFLMILPALGVGGKFLYQSEITGPIKEGITPRIRETAAQLLKLYILFTVVEILLLVLTNRALPFFDAVCLSLSNISTGGFSIRNDNIASYQNSATEWIVFIFMIIGSINFALYFHAFKLKFSRVYVPDFILFLLTAAIGCIVVSVFLIGQEGIQSVGEAFRLGSFQALSMQTSTGFVIANYDLWPFAPQMFMLLLMFIGGMSGSTASGIKTSRIYILYKIIIHRLESIYRPDSVRKLRIGTAEVDEKNAQTVLAFFCIVILFAVFGTVLLVLDHIDPETSLGMTACFLNNVGAAFRAAGPTDSFAFLSIFSKIVAILWMLLGRLEYFVVLLLFLPSFWKNE
jgi:trk system potassium uptake protein TrkH